MSLQSACAAQVATHETHGTAVGFLMGSFALTYASILFSQYRTDHIPQRSFRNTNQWPARRIVWVSRPINVYRRSPCVWLIVNILGWI